MTGDEVREAIAVLAACAHHDECRRAARTLNDDTQLYDVLRAADGAEALARQLAIHRRTAA